MDVPIHGPIQGKGDTKVRHLLYCSLAWLSRSGPMAWVRKLRSFLEDQFAELVSPFEGISAFELLITVDAH